MYDELVQRVGPRITKQKTWYREPLDPGLKIAISLRHLASRTKYAAMKFGWRVSHNTQSLIVREVCQAIIDEYLVETMTCPTTPETIHTNMKTSTAKTNGTTHSHYVLSILAHIVTVLSTGLVVVVVIGHPASFTRLVMLPSDK